MTEDQQTEWNYARDERLGMLCGPLAPTPEQKQIASDAAYGHLRDLQRLASGYCAADRSEP